MSDTRTCDELRSDMVRDWGELACGSGDSDGFAADLDDLIATARTEERERCAAELDRSGANCLDHRATAIYVFAAGKIRSLK